LSLISNLEIKLIPLYLIIPRSDTNKDIHPEIIEGINNIFPKDMENREITFISIYLYSHIKTYIINTENSPEDRTRIIVAAEILSNYMRPSTPFYYAPYSSKIHRQSIPGARLVMGAIFETIGIDIDHLMGFTDQEKYSIINMDYRQLFGRTNKIFWIIEIIGVDLFSFSYRKAEIKDLMIILDDYKSELLGLCPGIDLIKESLQVILDKKEGGKEYQ
jgi:hypothetical protein